MYAAVSWNMVGQSGLNDPGLQAWGLYLECASWHWACHKLGLGGCAKGSIRGQLSLAQLRSMPVILVQQAAVPNLDFVWVTFRQGTLTGQARFLLWRTGIIASRV